MSLFGPRQIHYADMERKATKSLSYQQMLSEITFNLQHAVRDARADGYAEALQDVMRTYGELELPAGEDSYDLLRDEIRRWAKDRGIDLERQSPHDAATHRRGKR